MGTLDLFPLAESNKLELEHSLFSQDEFTSRVGKVDRVCRRLTKVRVYRNLNKPEYFSILAMEGEDKGRVIGYAKSVLLSNCSFVVQTGARQKVLVQKRRSVHAFCMGILIDASGTVQNNLNPLFSVTYNPYFMDSFFRRGDLASFDQDCEQVLLQDSDVYILKK